MSGSLPEEEEAMTDDERRQLIQKIEGVVEMGEQWPEQAWMLLGEALDLIKVQEEVLASLKSMQDSKQH